jgi:ribosomal protein S1
MKLTRLFVVVIVVLSLKVGLSSDITVFEGIVLRVENGFVLIDVKKPDKCVDIIEFRIKPGEEGKLRNKKGRVVRFTVEGNDCVEESPFITKILGGASTHE